MSEPSRWGPPGFDPASSPTVPLPAARRPTPPRHAPLQPTRQIPFPPPADRPGYGADHGADHGDDYGADYGTDHRGERAYRDDDRSAYRDDDRPARRRSRGQLFVGVVLLLALMVSVLLGVLTYQALTSVDLISADPLGGLATWTATLGAVAFGAFGVFVLAVIAFAIARPKALAGFVLVASLVLPVGAVVLGVVYGADVLRQNVQNDVATESAEAARTLVEELERNVPDIGPLRDLIVWVVGQGA